MTQKNFYSAYSDLPLFLHRVFAHGSGGMRPRLDGLNMAFEFMSTTQHDQLCFRQKLCTDLLFFVFEVMPLDGNFAGQILKVQKILPCIQPEQLALAAASVRFWHVPDSDAQVSELIKNGNIKELVILIEKGISESNHNIYWLRQAMEAAALGSDPGWLANLLPASRERGSKNGNLPPALTALQNWFMGMAFWFDSEYERALEYFLAAPLKWPGLEEMIGHCLCRLGADEEGLPVLLAAVAERPWHVSLLKTIHDRLKGMHRPLSAVPASTAVLLYSWNKADDLDATLASLSASVGDMAKIICLDNGSSDRTPEVVSAWAGRLGNDLFHNVRLPVNIGAAAARNWLATLPETRACEYAAYIDDDTAVSKDWLRHLFRGADLYPRASSYGLRVVDAHAPFIVQSGPLHLTPLFAPLQGCDSLPGQSDGGEAAEIAFSSARAYAEPFNVSGTGGLGLEQADMGQFDFIGPCISTTGCCHMFRTSELAARGGFALSLSPSQYDDLEFDLRAAMDGGLSCHNGFCAVKHFKRTGGGAQLKGPAFGNALGNKYKLHGLYDEDRITEAARMETEALEDDFLLRLKDLDEVLL